MFRGFVVSVLSGGTVIRKEYLEAMRKRAEFKALLDELRSFKYDYDMPPGLEDAIDDVAYDLLVKFN